MKLSVQGRQPPGDSGGLRLPTVVTHLKDCVHATEQELVDAALVVLRAGPGFDTESAVATIHGLFDDLALTRPAVLLVDNVHDVRLIRTSHLADVAVLLAPPAGIDQLRASIARHCEAWQIPVPYVMPAADLSVGIVDAVETKLDAERVVAALKERWDV